MGCGQSKIHLYPRKSKSKANGKKSGHIDTDADADEEEVRHIDDANDKEINRDKDRIGDDQNEDDKELSETMNGEISVSLLRAKNLSLLQSQEISSSQQNFFRMLDKKIEDGPDYDSNSETEIALEEARLNALVQHWESASLTASLCSSASRSLQTTPVRQVPIRQPPMRSPLLINSTVVSAGSGVGMQTTTTQPLSAELLPTHSMHQHQQILIAAQTQPGQMLTGVGPAMVGPISSSHLQQQQQQHQLQLQQQHMQQLQQPLLTNVVVGSTQAQLLAAKAVAGAVNLSPKRQTTADGRTLLSQSVIHQSYGVGQQSLVGRPRQVPVTGIPTHMQQQMAYYGQPPPQTYFGEVLHPMQAPQTAAAPEYRFPPAISVQLLAPQVQRQLRETQELIKDSCPQLYAAGYGSPGPPLRTQPRGPRRPPSLETQYSQELS